VLRELSVKNCQYQHDITSISHIQTSEKFSVYIVNNFDDFSANVFVGLFFFFFSLKNVDAMGRCVNLTQTMKLL